LRGVFCKRRNSVLRFRNRNERKNQQQRYDKTILQI